MSHASQRCFQPDVIHNHSMEQDVLRTLIAWLIEEMGIAVHSKQWQ